MPGRFPFVVVHGRVDTDTVVPQPVLCRRRGGQSTGIGIARCQQRLRSYENKTHAEVRGVHLKRICVSSDFSSAGTKRINQTCLVTAADERATRDPRRREKGIRTNVKEVVEQDLRLAGLEADDAERVLAVQEEGLPTRRRMNANLFTKTYRGSSQ